MPCPLLGLHQLPQLATLTDFDSCAARWPVLSLEGLPSRLFIVL
jgi:hypothetical protein